MIEGSYVRTYRGTQNFTSTGRTCQRWDVQFPHEHRFTPLAHPYAGLDGHNYCRAPGGLRHNQVWCYTTDPMVKFDTCSVKNPQPELAILRGVRVERLHPFGGPALGGTSVTLIGSGFRKLSRGTLLHIQPCGLPPCRCL